MNPDKNAYHNADEEHDRGAVLVAAVIDGFLRSYHDGIEDLLRIATAGSGVLQPGALHPDLVARIASTACITAERITQICIRAFDYLPPVDVTFSDYLRALVTADIDLFPDDTIHLRANLIEGFRVRGIYPAGVVSLADDRCGSNLRIRSVLAVASSKSGLLDAAREFDRRRRSKDEVMSEEDDDDESFDPRSAAPEWARAKTRSRGPRASTLGDQALQALGLANPRPLADRCRRLFHQPAHGRRRLPASADHRPVHAARQADTEDLGGLVPMGGVTVVADGEGYVRYVIAKSLPSADELGCMNYGTSPHRSRTGSRPSHGAPTAIAASSSGST